MRMAKLEGIIASKNIGKLSIDNALHKRRVANNKCFCEIIGMIF